MHRAVTLTWCKSTLRKKFASKSTRLWVKTKHCCWNCFGRGRKSPRNLDWFLRESWVMWLSILTTPSLRWRSLKEAGGKNKIVMMRHLMIIDPTDTVVMMIMIGINTTTTSMKTSMITIHTQIMVLTVQWSTTLYAGNIETMWRSVRDSD